MTDFATEFADMPECQRLAFITGAAHVHRQTMDAIAAAYESGGLDAAFQTIRNNYNELCALIEVEDML